MQRKKDSLTVEFIPIKTKCTYYYPDKKRICRNCNNTKEYILGYHMIITDKKGHKIGYTVDTLGK